MQLYALNRSGEVVGAGASERAEDYFCLECAATVRLRSGPHRQAHFFHLAGVAHCRQNGKSLEHLEVQRFLQEQLGEECCHLEFRFPAINRIADVVWEPQRIVFEVQCSPITSEEIVARNRDYESLGYRVIWLLHERQFNRSRVSAAEMALRHRPFYFTNMDADGFGGFYDQFDVIESGWRVHRLEPLLVDLSKPLQVGADCEPSGLVRQRVGEYRTYFTGDLVDRTFTDPYCSYVKCAQALNQREPEVPAKANLWHHLVVRPYQVLFRLLLEKVSL